MSEYNKMLEAFKEVAKDSKEAREVIGGKVNNPSNDPYFANACTLRMSHALNAAELLPSWGDSKFFGEHLSSGGYDKKGNPVTNRTKFEEKVWHARYVKEMIPYLEKRYQGTTILSKVKPEGGFTDYPSSFKGKKGIIVFRVSSWGDATGHVDFWDGSACVHNCPDYIKLADSVQLFVAKDDTPQTPAPDIQKAYKKLIKVLPKLQQQLEKKVKYLRDLFR
jgi:hypothetical protein